MQTADDADLFVSACERASTVLGIAAVLAFPAAFLFGPLSSLYDAIILLAVALGGASLLCGGLAAIRAPEKLVGNTVVSEAGVFGEDGTIRSRHQARFYAKVYAGVGLVLFLGGGLGALAAL